MAMEQKGPVPTATDTSSTTGHYYPIATTTGLERLKACRMQVPRVETERPTNTLARMRSATVDFDQCRPAIVESFWVGNLNKPEKPCESCLRSTAANPAIARRAS